jgi:hypothetical protein
MHIMGYGVCHVAYTLAGCCSSPPQVTTATQPLELSRDAPGSTIRGMAGCPGLCAITMVVSWGTPAETSSSVITLGFQVHSS